MFLESVSAEGATVFGVFSILLYCLKMVGDNAFQWEKEEEEEICQKWQLTGKEPNFLDVQSPYLDLTCEN